MRGCEFESQHQTLYGKIEFMFEKTIVKVHHNSHLIYDKAYTVTSQNFLFPIKLDVPLIISLMTQLTDTTEEKSLKCKLHFLMLTLPYRASPEVLVPLADLENLENP